MSRSVERVLEEAHLSGDLKLNGRKLKEFPSTDKYDLHDTVFADLSRNRFSELPVEVTRFWCLEHLNLYHNAIRSIPDSITYLQSLVYLDISHNQLSALPSSIFHLPLEILLVSNNKLQSLPSELGYCKTLAELDVSCNQISRLPPQLGLLTLLRSLNIRSNMLLELPIELTYLRLTRLDMSRNRIASLPVELKNMSPTLEILRLSDNPLMAPPAVVCARGMVHVFKWLELRCSKQENNKKSSFQGETKNKKRYDLPKNQFSDTSSIDWPFLSGDINLQLYSTSDEKLLHSKNSEKRGSDEVDKPLNSSYRSGSTKSLDSQMLSMNKLNMKNQIQDSQVGEKCHLQTYREYKESLRQQRTVDSVYKCPQREMTNGNSKPPILPEPAPAPVPVTVTEPKITSPDIKVKSSPIKEPPPNCEKVVVKSLTRTKSKNLNDIPFDKMQFTMRREYEKAKEEAELIRQLRITIESRLKVVLPEDLSSALSDGVVLCHFANHIMPHSVASIHVPSPTVPKLTTARCRRNVDNFLEACRKIGIEEELICNRNDILEMKENILPTVAVIVCKLLKKANQHFIFNSQHHKPPLLNESFGQNHNTASASGVLSPQHIVFEKFSTTLCLLIFISVNLLLYMCPIPS